MYEQIINFDEINCESSEIPGITFKVLSGVPEKGPSVAIYYFAPRATIPAHFHSVANETAYVLDGDFVENGKAFGPGTVLFGPAGAVHGPHYSEKGCTILFALSRELDFNVSDLNPAS
ncbi:MAG: cupin domain-containing protein [Comamonadaceae bacterium]|nr:cupin domain-containing protein [Comamonadaceae bacterium]